MTAIVALTMGLGFHVFAYVLNDVVDLPIDRSDPRRRHGPLVRGLVTTTTALAVAGAAFAMGLLATLGAPLAALAFVAAGLGLGAYDLFGKRTRHPWLSDVVQGAGWAALVIAGAAVAGPPTALTFTVAAYVAAFIVQANGVHGAIRDLAVDSALDVPTTARLLGAGIGVDGDRVIPARVYRYAWALEGLLVALAAAAMAVGGAAVAAVPMACSVADPRRGIAAGSRQGSAVRGAAPPGRGAARPDRPHRGGRDAGLDGDHDRRLQRPVADARVAAGVDRLGHPCHASMDRGGRGLDRPVRSPDAPAQRCRRRHRGRGRRARRRPCRARDGARVARGDRGRTRRRRRECGERPCGRRRGPGQPPDAADRRGSRLDSRSGTVRGRTGDPGTRAGRSPWGLRPWRASPCSRRSRRRIPGTSRASPPSRAWASSATSSSPGCRGARSSSVRWSSRTPRRRSPWRRWRSGPRCSHRRS